LLQENYKDAITLRDEIDRMHVDDFSSVLRANSDFYQAFTSKSSKLMADVWLQDVHVQVRNRKNSNMPDLIPEHRAVLNLSNMEKDGCSSNKHLR
jgi:hypothetical protein